MTATHSPHATSGSPTVEMANGFTLFADATHFSLKYRGFDIVRFFADPHAYSPHLVLLSEAVMAPDEDGHGYDRQTRSVFVHGVLAGLEPFVEFFGDREEEHDFSVVMSYIDGIRDEVELRRQHTRADWREAVADGLTDLGYEDWFAKATGYRY